MKRIAAFGVFLLVIAIAISLEVRKPDSLFAQETKPLFWLEAVEGKIPEFERILKLGEKRFQKTCAFCHGSQGKGNGEAAKFLVTKPRDFTSGTFKFQSAPIGSLPTDEDLFRTITVGFPEYGMPSFN